MAWSWRATDACDLRATLPATAPGDALAFGFAARAPEALRPRAEPLDLRGAAPAEIETAAITWPEDDLSLQLLGGPEGERSSN